MFYSYSETINLNDFFENTIESFYTGYLEGKAANRCDNPYKENTYNRKAWNLGYERGWEESFREMRNVDEEKTI